MLNLNISAIHFNDSEVEIDYHISPQLKEIDSGAPIKLNYAFLVKKDYTWASMVALGSFLPYLVSRDSKIKVTLPIAATEWLKEYWQQYLTAMFESSFSIEWVFTAQYSTEEKEDSLFSSNASNRIGLFYGGGVESTFALSTFYHKNPILISINGKNWMNADKDKSPIKYNLISELTQKYGLSLEEVSMNVRNLIKDTDAIFNRFVTGNLFYFLAAPIADKFGIGTLYLSTELEYALEVGEHDQSIHPRFVNNVFVKKPSWPLFMSIYMGFPKVSMFAKLAKTDFIKYIYSCFNNSQKRWCGACSKCFRISEFCDRIHLDRQIIGMQEGITGRREHSPVTRYSWQYMDKIYGRKYMREFVLLAKHAIKKFKKKFLKINS